MRLKNEIKFKVKLYLAGAKTWHSRTKYQDQLSRYLDLGMKINLKLKVYVPLVKISNSRTEYQDQLSRYLDLGIKINVKLKYMSLVWDYQIQESNTETNFQVMETKEWNQI